jgi:hypothetical protein
MSEKKPYDVYVEITRSFEGEITIQRMFAGKTYAVSEKKAINNVRFRIDGKTGNFQSDERGDDWRDRTYAAYPAGTTVELWEVAGGA